MNKKIIFVISLIIIFILLIIYFRSDEIFQTIQDPRQPFQTYVKPPAPDYNLESSWLSLPNLNSSPKTDDPKGDVFVVVPSVYRGGKHWLLRDGDLRRKNKLKTIVKPNYVAPYGDAGRLFAPYYRQASIYSYYTNSEDALKAQDFAYKDVQRAFKYFLKKSPPERPIVLVGHNQGASHVQRLLADSINDKTLKRLAVAYIIDYPLPLDTFDNTLSKYYPCISETATNCIVSFGAFMPGDYKIAKKYLKTLMVHDGKDYIPINKREILCVNPLTWTLSETYAPASLHKGGVAAEGLDPDVKPAAMTKEVGAICENGILNVDKPNSRSLRRPFIFGSKFRTLPSNLFYEDLKVNAKKRVDSLISSGALPIKAPDFYSDDIQEIKESPVSSIIQ